MSLDLTSPAFTHEGPIPARHTCDSEDVSPALRWSGVPQGSASLALIVDDPDAPDPEAPKMTWVHWVLYNIPADSDGLAEGIGRDELPGGTLEGTTDYGEPGWRGPCPPIGRHRYFFKLFALDVELADLGQPTSAELQAAMDGHVIEAVELMGTYQR